jgi:hypothetical protein
MHEAAKGYHPAYRPHTVTAEKKIKAACDRVRDAVAVAELDPTAKLDVLSAMKWALKEFHDATYPLGTRIDPDSRRPDAVASEPARRPEAASIPPKRPKLTAAAKRTDSPQLSSTASSTSTAARGSAVAQPGDRKRSSNLADLLQEDETQSLQSLLTTMSDQDIALIGGSPSAAFDERELATFVRSATRDADNCLLKKTPAEAFDLLTKRTSHLLTHTIVDRLEKMYREFTDAPVPLQQQDLTFMTGRVNQYELSANDAVQSMHEAAKGYHPAYRPHTVTAEKKIKAPIPRYWPRGVWEVGLCGRHCRHSNPQYQTYNHTIIH